jgi:hypothetical protein
LLDLTKDLINVAPVNNFGIDVGNIWISDLTSIKPALLVTGSQRDRRIWYRHLC